MIDYDFGHWGLGFIWKRSNILERASCIALVPAFFAGCLRFAIVSGYLDEIIDATPQLSGMLNLWGGFSFVLTFLLVFRTQMAYGRYWDGIGSLQQVFGVWFNATSNLMAFSSVDEFEDVDPEKAYKVLTFQHLLVRLMSLLFCTALQEIAVMEDENFGIIRNDGISAESLMHLSKSPDRLEIVMQWVQRLLVDNTRNGIINIDAPILSRVFQELSNGIVQVHDAMKIAEYPFPFPFAQMLTIMLLVFTSTLPLICAFVVEHPFFAGGVCYGVIMSMWTVNYIAAEIEMPFGDDPNDLPVRELNDQFNRKLVSLMDPLTQNVPGFMYSPEQHDVIVADQCHLISVQAHESYNKNESQEAVFNALGQKLADKATQARKSQHWRERHSKNWRTRRSNNDPDNPKVRPSHLGLSEVLARRLRDSTGSCVDNKVACHRCGTAFTDDANYCRHCGEPRPEETGVSSHRLGKRSGVDRYSPQHDASDMDLLYSQDRTKHPHQTKDLGAIQFVNPFGNSRIYGVIDEEFTPPHFPTRTTARSSNGPSRQRSHNGESRWSNCSNGSIPLSSCRTRSNMTLAASTEFRTGSSGGSEEDPKVVEHINDPRQKPELPRVEEPIQDQIAEHGLEHILKTPLETQGPHQQAAV